MKIRLLAVLVIMCLGELSWATLPWPSQVVISPSSNPIALLQSSPSESLVIRSNDTVLCRFIYKDFGIPERATIDLMSTAGLLWHRDSISFFETSERYLIMRLRWGRYVIVDLRTRTVSLNMPAGIQQEVEGTVMRQILAWLKSSDPRDRENGARYAGDLKLHEAIGRLKELTADPAKGDYKDGDAPWVKSYWVRKAAVNALKEMDIDVNDVVLEEPKE